MGPWRGSDSVDLCLSSCCCSKCFCSILISSLIISFLLLGLGRVLLLDWWWAGMVTNSFLFCWFFTIKDPVLNKCVFNNTRQQSVDFDSLLLARQPWWWWCPCFSVVPEATDRANWGPLKGAVSTQKSPSMFQDGDKRKLQLGGREEISISSTRGLIFYRKRNGKKLR